MYASFTASRQRNRKCALFSLLLPTPQLFFMNTFLSLLYGLDIFSLDRLRAKRLQSETFNHHRPPHPTKLSFLTLLSTERKIRHEHIQRKSLVCFLTNTSAKVSLTHTTELNLKAFLMPENRVLCHKLLCLTYVCRK